jgi:enamine deaminase RidA (YjgF/YER057c/UK114 family)
MKIIFPLVIIMLLVITNGFAQVNTPAVSFFNSPSVASPKGYSHAARIDLGTVTMLVISGQVALGNDGIIVGQGDMSRQADQSFKNIKSIVEAAGGNMGQIVKLSFYLTDISQIQRVREVRDRYINTVAPPTSTAVQIGKLFRDDLLIEIEATVIIPKR